MNIKYNEKYDTELFQLVQQNKYGYYGKLQKCKALKYLDDYIFECTRFLDETEKHTGKKFANRAVRVFYTLNHIDHQLTCCVCGKPYIISRYFSMTEKCHVDIEHLHCCHLCAMNDSRTQERITETFMEHYGCKSCFQAESVKQKIGDTNEGRYQARNFSQSKRYLEIGEVHNWWPEIEEQRKHRGKVLKQTFARKTKEEKAQALEKSKATSLRLYGVENWVQSQAAKDKYKNKEWVNKKKAKEINTKIKNGTINTSKPEEMIYKRLCNIFGLADVKRQYKENRYPFFCDFYILSLDLFIELNAHWTHGDGFGFFDKDNDDHMALYNKWASRIGSDERNFYSRAIKTWTQLDLRKAQTAIDNNLRYLVFWNFSEADEWLNRVDPDKMRLLMADKDQA